MFERIYKYRVTCTGNGTPGCPKVVEYETTEKKGLPAGWHDDSYAYYGDWMPRHFCPTCWKAHCRYMAGRPGHENGYNYALKEIENDEFQAAKEQTKSK